MSRVWTVKLGRVAVGVYLGLPTIALGHGRLDVDSFSLRFIFEWGEEAS